MIAVPRDFPAAETGPTGLLTSEIVAQLEEQVRLRLAGESSILGCRSADRVWF